MRKEKLEELKGYINEMCNIKTSDENKEAKFLKTKTSSYLLNNGNLIIREEIIKNNINGDAVTILPIINNDEVILVVQPRPLTKNTVTVEVPAGYIDLGETCEMAALRELREETGYISNDLIKLSSYYQDQGCSRAMVHSFIAPNAIKKYNQDLDKDEYIKYFICKFEEALELIEMGYIVDCNTIITMEKAKQCIRR